MKHKNIIRMILLVFFATFMLVSLGFLLHWYFENKKVEDIVLKETKHIIQKENVTYLNPEIKKDNPNTIGWLTVDDTNINYPVLQYTDNTYYLNHDFNNQPNSAGWIFMDSNNSFSDQNLVIYGHHRRDGSMFGSIESLFQSNEKIITISLTTFDEVINYQIFSIYHIASNDFYNKRNFDNLSDTIKLFKKRSEVSFSSNLKDTTQVITLSTCDNNNRDRLVVQGYKK